MRRWELLPVLLLASSALAEDAQKVVLRAWGVPEHTRNDLHAIADRRIVEEFQRRFPHVEPVAVTGLVIPGRSTMDIRPLMQIAGDIPPHVLYVNFRQSDTYIRNKFLHPLDHYVEKLAGVTIPRRHLLSLDDYLTELRKGPGFAGEIKDRVPYQCWQVMRRECPYEDQCPHCDGPAPPPKKHAHVWCFPVGPDFIALFYRKDLLFEAGLPDRVPETYDEMLAWCRKLTNPRDDRYGLKINLTELGWSTMSFLYSYGGRVVEKDPNGDWRCVFDSEEAVEAYYMVARFFLEEFTNEHGKFRGVVYLDESVTGGEIKSGMEFEYLDQRFFAERDPAQYGFGPVPKGPTGQRGAEFNSRMVGIYAGLADDVPRRDAAWNYIHFFDGPESRMIRARTMIENGQGRYVRAELLAKAGYPEYVRQVPKGWEQAAQTALDNGIPEPYGKNCQKVYRYVSKAIGFIRTDGTIRKAIDANDPAAAKARIREILQEQVRTANEKMLNILTPEQRQFRNRVALGVAIAIFLAFAAVFHRVFKVFAKAQVADPSEKHKGGWQFGRYMWAYILLVPAVGSILLWSYWPLLRGTVIAFQDYNVRGFSRFVGMENFANVLFDEEFWYSVRVALEYTALFILFGFCAPIVLAFLLTEVPRGKILFRVIYYLPAVLTGVIVIFLWKGFYGQYGMINKVINGVIWAMNLLPNVHLEEVHIAWLDSPTFALFFCLLPTVWAGMGPGCLIYLAALKTVPEELYEAADIDGAGMWAKVHHIAVPGIKALILINFIGAIIGVMKTGAGFILAMTAGEPHGRTELVGLHIYWQAFAYLRFGPATAMAWVLGAMLIGFTVVQLQRLSRMEFRTAQGVGE
ncbi:MAG TPA: extracellular solute-binding protein [Phycisphaerae bacterium]|nr:extracellular solute-binding protein [Phycisphaerae bacterium]